MNEALASFLSANQESHLNELLDLLRIPSVSTDIEYARNVRTAAIFIQEKLGELGFETKLIETDKHPAVFANYKVSAALPTVLIYGHYDVQPADPLELWNSPPFEPVVKDGLILARGSSDDKGQVYAHIKGVESLIKTTGTLPVNVSFIIEGEEEIGSPNLPKLINDYKSELTADIVLISDSSMLAANTPTITYGLKGLSYVEVTLKAANRDLHSGAYGGGVPNPINILSRMIASLHDEDGKVTVPGFYDDVIDITLQEKEAFANTPFDAKAFAGEIGLTHTPGEAGYTLLERLWARPTLDVNGIKGGYQGEGAKTVIASEASAKISCRIVPNQVSDDITKKLGDYLRELAPAGVTVEIEDLHGGMPALTPIDSEAVQLAAEALEQAYGQPAVFARTGGSIPIVTTFQQILNADVVLVGFGLEDDRVHSPNEKFNLENYFTGIRSSALMLKAFAGFNS